MQIFIFAVVGSESNKMNIINDSLQFKQFQIRALCTKRNRFYFSNEQNICNELVKYLTLRGWEDNSVEGLSKINHNEYHIKISKINELQNEYFYFNITFNKFFKKPYTILYLIIDFCKINYQWLYFIEILSEQDIALIKELGRRLSPELILSRTTDTNYNKPQLLYKLYDSYNYDLYYGSKIDFADQIDFWSAIISWVSFGLVNIPEKIEDIEISNSYNENLGICIPQKTENWVKIQNNIQKSDLKFASTVLKSCYCMKNEWNNEMYLFESEEYYFLYNCWTNN